MRVSRVFVPSIAEAVLRLGITSRVARSRWRTRRLLVLCYHGFATHDEHEWDPQLYLSPRTFRRRLEFLHREGYCVLPLGEGLERLRAGDLPPKAIVLTVDDGFADFAEVAAPILDEYHFPATVYLTTYYVQHQMPVFNVALRYVLWKGRTASARSLPGDSVAHPGRDLASAEGREALALSIIQNCESSNASAEAKNDLLQRIAAVMGVDWSSLVARRTLHLMAPAQISRLARQVDFQLHTHRHHVPMDRTKFLREIADNRAALEAMLGSSGGRVHFCYPSGVHHSAFLPWLEEAGIQSATTCEPGIAAASIHPLLTPRFIDTEGVPQAVFAGWAAGLLPMLVRLVRGPVGQGRSAGGRDPARNNHGRT